MAVCFHPAVFTSNKGDFSNRMECSRELIKNNAKTTVGLAGAVAATSGTAYALTKNDKLVKAIATPIKNFGKWLTKEIPMSNKLVRELKALGKNPKAVAMGAVIAGGAAVINAILTKSVYRAGQIDQKYTDKAKLEAGQDKIFA